MNNGPLSTLQVVELAGLGPAPFCGMVLADLGANVIKVDRVSDVIGGHSPSSRYDLLDRGKRSMGLNLKSGEGVEIALQLISGLDVLIEGFRPGVAEKLGIGPAESLAVNTRLVYGRMTGWGQDGPYASMAGHDIDYIALSGALHPVGGADHPIPPLNLVGDFGGGGMLLALGVVSAVLHARETGIGQVIDAAMVDGSALLTTMQHGMMASGTWQPQRESNLLDGAAPFYTTYETSDGEHVAVGALEPQFFAALLDGLELEPTELPNRLDREGWPALREALAKRFIQRTRDEWDQHFAGTDACVAPVLSLMEASSHPHNVARGGFVELDGVSQPGPAPRFSETAASLSGPPAAPGADTELIMASLGYSPSQIGMLRTSGTIA